MHNTKPIVHCSGKVKQDTYPLGISKLIGDKSPLAVCSLSWL